MKVVCIRSPRFGEFVVGKIYENLGRPDIFDKYRQYLMYDSTNRLKIVDAEFFITMDEHRENIIRYLEI